MPLPNRVSCCCVRRLIKGGELFLDYGTGSGILAIAALKVLFSLSASVKLDSVAGDILKLLSTEVVRYVSSTVVSPEYRLRATVLQAPYGDLISCMEMAKVADLIAFVASASSLSEEDTSEYVDSFGKQCLSVFRSIGLPSTAVLIGDLPSVSKKRNELKKMCTSNLSSGVRITRGL